MNRRGFFKRLVTAPVAAYLAWKWPTKRVINWYPQTIPATVEYGLFNPPAALAKMYREGAIGTMTDWYDYSGNGHHWTLK